MPLFHFFPPLGYHVGTRRDPINERQHDPTEDIGG